MLFYIPNSQTNNPINQILQLYYLNYFRTSIFKKATLDMGYYNDF